LKLDSIIFLLILSLFVPQAFAQSEVENEMDNTLFIPVGIAVISIIIWIIFRKPLFNWWGGDEENKTIRETIHQMKELMDEREFQSWLEWIIAKLKEKQREINDKIKELDEKRDSDKVTPEQIALETQAGIIEKTIQNLEIAIDQAKNDFDLAKETADNALNTYIGIHTVGVIINIGFDIFKLFFDPTDLITFNLSKLLKFVKLMKILAKMKDLMKLLEKLTELEELLEKLEKLKELTDKAKDIVDIEKKIKKLMEEIDDLNPEKQNN